MKEINNDHFLMTERVKHGIVGKCSCSWNSKLSPSYQKLYAEHDKHIAREETKAKFTLLQGGKS